MMQRFTFSATGTLPVGNEKIGKVYRGITYSTKDIQRACLSIVVSDSFVDATVEAIIESGATGEVGDGKILPCDEPTELELEKEEINHLTRNYGIINNK